MDEYSASSSSFAAAHEVATNSDLLIEILIRLPIRSLMRFKSVSKSWLSVITSDFFALRRNPDATTISGLLLHPFTINIIPKLDFIPLINTTKRQTDDPHPQFIDLPFFPGFSGNIRIIGSCLGLLLCCFGDTQNNSPKPDYVILNPTTKQFKILPKCHLFDLRGLTLAFDPSKSPHYKVVCLHYTGSVSMSYTAGPNYQILMYSSETGSWKASGVPFGAKWREQFNSGVYWNGAINWFSNWGSGDSVYYNVDEERLGIIPLLPIPEGSYWSTPEFRLYGESRGHLHLVQTHDLTRRVDVYEMERDYSRWFLKHSVDPYAVGVPSAPWFGMFSTLCVVQIERDEESFLVLNIPGKILRYSFGDRTLEKICDVAVGTLHEAPLIYSWPYSYQYIESLSGV